MSTATQHPAQVPVMSRPHVNNLLYVLRRANQRYSQLAAAVRMSLRPTHHARKRAAALHLRVSIKAARNLDQKQISVLPLPVLEREERVSTPPQPAAVAAPLPLVQLSRAVVGREREMKRRSASRPVLRCDIPQYPQVQQQDGALASCVTIAIDTPVSSLVEPQVTSCWSATTSGGEVATEMEEDNVVYSSDYEEGMDLDDSPTVDSSSLMQPAGVLDANLNNNAPRVGRYPPRLDVPLEAGSFSWGSDLSSGLSSGSTSSSAGGLVTPGDNDDMPKLTIRLKRKPSESFLDMDDDSASTLEKRPRYERKPWAQQATRRTHQRTTSMHSSGSYTLRRF
ncbi:hypothetical protein BDZ97DRAFT_1267434 [Flammula alnicola]|nr:hypothetical protein BDZ97DRAFT_1267434 [Flammula alnicola]